MSTASKPGDLVHSDLCGPMEEASFSKCRYFVVFQDEHKRADT
jgi:hypothetical protein